MREGFQQTHETSDIPVISTTATPSFVNAEFGMVDERQVWHRKGYGIKDGSTIWSPTGNDADPIRKKVKFQIATMK
jgi:hypothetical protein